MDLPTLQRLNCGAGTGTIDTAIIIIIDDYETVIMNVVKVAQAATYTAHARWMEILNN